MLERTRMFAREHHVTVAQAALAYVLCHPLHAFAVVGCTTFDKFAQNVAALSLGLDEAALHWLATGQPPRSRFPSS
jgi:aryl-alcohol dehydrogenase-like predicted oxidoreductase